MLFLPALVRALPKTNVHSLTIARSFDGREALLPRVPRFRDGAFRVMEIRTHRRRLWDFLLGFSATLGVLWLLIESLSAFFPCFTPKGLAWYSAFLLVSAFGGICRARPAKRVELRIPLTDSRFEIACGDIFSRSDVAVIPVNEYFDGEIGDPVSKNSLHGQFIERVLGGQTQSFFDLTEAALAQATPAETGVEHRTGRATRYEVGTVARIDVRARRYLLAVLAHTDLESLAASATLQDLWACLEGVWKAIREHSDGGPAVLPLLGSGLSKIGLPAMDLIRIILISFVYHTKERKIAGRVTLLLPPHLLGDVDLKTIKRSWR